MTSTCNMMLVPFFARMFALTRSRAPRTAFDAGLVALSRRQFDAALTLFGEALAEASTPAGRAAVHNKCGIAHLRQGKRDAAIGAFADALMADWRFVPAIVNVGNLLLEDGAVSDAIEHYEAALRIDDGYAPAHLNLGVAYRRLGRRHDAVRELRRADRLAARLRRVGPPV